MPHRRTSDPSLSGEDLIAGTPRTAAAPQDEPPWSIVHVLAYGSVALPTLLAGTLWFVEPLWKHFLTSALLTHMALVLTFLGGIHWGIAMRFMATDSRMPMFHFLWGPVPGYTAWLLLMTAAPIAVGCLMVLGLATFWVDLRTWPGSGLGPWMRLRRTFAAGTLICGAIALAALSLGH